MINFIKNAIAELIAQEKHNISDLEIANRFNINPSTLCRWRSGETNLEAAEFVIKLLQSLTPEKREYLLKTNVLANNRIITIRNKELKEIIAWGIEHNATEMFIEKTQSLSIKARVNNKKDEIDLNYAASKYDDIETFLGSLNEEFYIPGYKIMFTKVPSRPIFVLRLLKSKKPDNILITSKAKIMLEEALLKPGIIFVERLEILNLFLKEESQWFNNHKCIDNEALFEDSVAASLLGNTIVFKTSLNKKDIVKKISSMGITNNSFIYINKRCKISKI